MDCLGLYLLILREVAGLEIEDLSEGKIDPDDRVANAEAIEKFAIQTGNWIKVESPAIFDAVLLNVLGEPCHIGCCIGDGEMIHSLRGHDSVKESFKGAKWRNRVKGFWRPIALA